MKKRKLEISNETKMKLQEMRKLLAGVEPDTPGDLDVAMGCGGTCYVTCSYWCELQCAGSCLNSGESQKGCGYRFVMPYPPVD